MEPTCPYNNFTNTILYILLLESRQKMSYQNEDR